jgi:18S rRNA (adenine1779-N6/adenine1780-N6)-dimethyltransferase
VSASVSLFGLLPSTASYSRLRQNYKVYCTLHNIPIDESLADAATTSATTGEDMDMDVDVDNDDDAVDKDEGEGAGDGMDEDEDEDMPTFFKEMKDAEAAKEASKTPSRNPKSKVALVVKAKVDKVLTGTGLGEKRARMCDQNDFLKLLLGEFFSLIFSLRGES